MSGPDYGLEEEDYLEPDPEDSGPPRWGCLAIIAALIPAALHYLGVW